MANDIMIFLIIAISYLTIRLVFEKRVKGKNEQLENDDIGPAIICAYYVFLRLPVFIFARQPMILFHLWNRILQVLHKIHACLNFIIMKVTVNLTLIYFEDYSIMLF